MLCCRISDGLTSQKKRCREVKTENRENGSEDGLCMRAEYECLDVNVWSVEFT